MRFVGGFVLAALCLVAASHAKVELEEGILVINKDNFDSVIKDNDYVLIEFCEYIRSGNLLLSRSVLHFLHPGRVASPDVSRAGRGRCDA